MFNRSNSDRNEKLVGTRPNLYRISINIKTENGIEKLTKFFFSNCTKICLFALSLKNFPNNLNVGKMKCRTNDV